MYFRSVITCQTAVELRDEVGAADAAQLAFDVGSLFRFVPKEELSLCQFLAWSAGTEDRLESIGIETRVPHLCADGHWCWREVLHLFKFEVQTFCNGSKLSHVLFSTAWMATDEVGDDLLAQVLLPVDALEDFAELPKLVKRRLAHELQYAVRSVLRGHL